MEKSCVGVHGENSLKKVQKCLKCFSFTALDDPGEGQNPKCVGLTILLFLILQVNRNIK